MKRLFPPGSIPFLKQSQKWERQMRSRATEHQIMMSHEALYVPLKCRLENATLTRDELGGFHPASIERKKHLAHLRALVANGARERCIQNALLKSGLLSLDCHVIAEVAMARTEEYPGMRMDLVLSSTDARPTQVLELKRGTHLLLAHAGKSAERLSRQIEKAANQIKAYRGRLEHDAETVVHLEGQHGVRFDQIELRLIAGRRSTEGGYHLLGQIEADSSCNLQIYTWDGFLAELERIVD